MYSITEDVQRTEERDPSSNDNIIPAANSEPDSLKKSDIVMNAHERMLRNIQRRVLCDDSEWSNN